MPIHEGLLHITGHCLPGSGHVWLIDFFFRVHSLHLPCGLPERPRGARGDIRFANSVTYFLER
jgi:hypothetical protein